MLCVFFLKVALLKMFNISCKYNLIKMKTLISIKIKVKLDAINGQANNQLVEYTMHAFK